MSTTLKTLREPVIAFEKLCDLIKDINFAMLTTVTADGRLRSRPMGTQQVDTRDGALWFFATKDSPKVEEIFHEQQVCVTYAEPAQQTYVSVSGQALVIRDKDKVRELWTDSAQTWFPKGADDPRLILLRVGIESAEYWDAPSNAVVQLYQQAKAILTGEAPKDFGENVKVDIM
jgi:general stress protein 26